MIDRTEMRNGRGGTARVVEYSCSNRCRQALPCSLSLLYLEPGFVLSRCPLRLRRQPSSTAVFITHRVTTCYSSARGAVLLKLPTALPRPCSPLHHGFPEADAVGRGPIGRGVEESSWYVLADEQLCRLSKTNVPLAVVMRYACSCFVPYRQDI